MSQKMGRSYQSVRLLWLIFVFLLTLVFILNLDWLIVGFDTAIIVENFSLIFLALIVGLIHLAIRAFILQQAIISQGVGYGWFRSLNLLLRSDFIGVTTFPGKIFADTYKYFDLKKLGSKRAILAVVIFRAALMLGSFWPLFIITWQSYPLLTITLGLVLAGLLFFAVEKLPRLKDYQLILKNRWLFLHTIFLSFISAGSLLILFAQFCLLLAVFGLSVSFDLFIIFILVYILGASSNLPFGLGITEVSYLVYLNYLLPVSSIITFLALWRLIGPVFTAFLGWLSLGHKAVKDMVTGHV